MRWIDIVVIFLILFVVIFMIYSVYFMKSNGADCIRDPLNYFQMKTQSQCICLKTDNYLNNRELG